VGRRRSTRRREPEGIPFARTGFSNTPPSIVNSGKERFLQMPKIKTSSGITMYYEQHGQGTDLLLISGLSASCTAWRSVLEPLSRKYRVTVFDNRGAGQTETPPGLYTVEMMAHDTVSLMDALGIEQSNIIGHSMGGMILQELCLSYPEKVSKAIMNASTSAIPLYSMNHIMSVVKLWESGAPLEIIIEIVFPWLYADDFLADAGKVDEAVTMLVNNPYPQSLDGFKAQVEACRTQQLQHRISAIQIPSLIIAGQEDILIPLRCSEYLHNNIPNSKLEIISNCGHLIQVEQPEAFCKSVTTFLN
jgi:pimeloyl-ACP methyl ester carboxylesterase